FGHLSKPGERSHRPDEWYHGTPYHYDHPDPYQAHDFQSDMDEPDHDHWNSQLGAHFAAKEGTAAGFVHESSGGDHEDEPGYIMHARLHIANPKHYDLESEMDREAYAHEFEAGNHPHTHDPDFEELWRGDPSVGHHDDLRDQPESL